MTAEEWVSKINEMVRQHKRLVAIDNMAWPLRLLHRWEYRRRAARKDELRDEIMEQWRIAERGEG